MTLVPGQLLSIPDGVRGFDCNTTIQPADAAAFHRKGYRFAVRYVKRDVAHPYDLTTTEALNLLRSGLALMVVQHVAPPGWLPTRELGLQYSHTAVDEVWRLGLPVGAMLWCDLEGVNHAASAEDVIKFCNYWHDVVKKAGYLPGLYVGYAAGLTGEQLYKRLQFSHYWAAYNLNRDEYPIKRGVQLQQAARQLKDVVPGVRFPFDVNASGTDFLGEQAVVLAPPGWPEV